jgi:hypothetical protein
MVDEAIQGNKHLRKLNANLQDIAHFFVFQNVELMVP